MSRDTLKQITILFIALIIMGIGVNRLTFHIDEAWFGEQSYFQYHSGVARSDFFEGMLNYENTILVRHKLFIYLGSLMIGTFGLDIIPLRILSVVSSLLLLFLLFFFYHKNDSKDKKSMLYAGSVLLLCPLYIKYSMTFRPELLLAVVGFCVFLFALRADESNRMLFAFIAGVFAGVAVLIHLNGLMFIGAGSLLFAVRKKPRLLAIYLISSLLAASFYTYDIIGNVEIFLHQFRNDPALENRDFQISSVFTKVLDEHKRYFRKTDIIIITTFYFYSLFVNKFKFQAKNASRNIFLLGTVLSLGLISQSNTTKYALPVLPYFSIEIGIALSNIQARYSTFRKAIPASALILVLITGGVGLFSAASMMKNNVRVIIEKYDEISGYLPEGSKVLAPMKFMFNEIENHEIVSLYWADMALTGRKNIMEWGRVTAFARDHSVEYIILDPDYMRRINGFESARNEVVRIQDYLVYKINP